MNGSTVIFPSGKPGDGIIEQLREQDWVNVAQAMKLMLPCTY